MNNYYYNQSISNVKKGIQQKLDYSTPYYARDNTVKGMVTDMDHFPYTRFFRGNFRSEEPTIFNREAGYRRIDNSCYHGIIAYPEPHYPNFCFQAPCSTVYPCAPAYLQRENDKPSLDIFLNKLCVLKSP
jgi:hypothetical protein